jgi:8-amino-7-oxononanoate synthase
MDSLFLKPLTEQLERRRTEHLYRERLILDSPQGVEIRIGSETLLSFCSNDYLGLAQHPAVIAAFKAGADRYGVGAGASHLVSGHSAAHHALEEELAEFVGAKRALLFSTGYMANFGVMNALCGRETTIFEDRLNHASLIDAARLTRAKVKRYPHADIARLDRLLTDMPGQKFITTDTVFSMDGDMAPLKELHRLAERHGAWLLADDAHGLGVLGKDGRGSFEHFGVPLAPPAILMGTLGKAFGVFGAFVAGEEALIETLIQQARTYIYTTALPPAVAEAVRASLKIVRAESWRRERLQALVARFRQGAQELGFTLVASETPIQPLILSDARAALDVSQKLRAQGILVPAIRPPTVPEGSARLRFTFSAAHEFSHVERLLAALATMKPA